MAFKKLSYCLCDAGVTIKCDHTPLHKFLAAHTLNSKVNNGETEIASMSYVTFEHIKVTANILASHTSRLRSMGFYDVLDLEEWGM